jgi:hypothetical protein
MKPARQLGLSPEAETAYMRGEVAQMRAELEAAKENGQENGKADASIVNRLEKVVLSQEERLKAKLGTPADPGISFEETGIDYLVVTNCTTTRTSKPTATSRAPPSRPRSGPPTCT